MPIKFALSHPILKMWILLRQTYISVSKCEEATLAKAGLTLQQYKVLMAIKYINDPVTPTEVARWLDRNTNSISLIIDRMEKDGLVKRARDLKDRRALRLVMTQKGKDLFEQATVPGWELMKRMMSCFSEEEMQTFTHLMERLRERALEELTPGESAEEVKINDIKNITHFIARTSKGKNSGL